MAESEDRQRRSSKPAVAEWIIAGVSALAVLAMIGFLATEALTETGSQPDLVAEVTGIVQRSNSFNVQIDLFNRGDATAAGVDVEGTLTLPDGTSQTSSMTLDYAPAHSRNTIALVFSTDPNDGELAIRATGFSDP